MLEQGAAKFAPSLAAATIIPALARLPFDAWWLLFVPMGLLLGWSARAGKLLGERKSWADIRHDLIVSLLIGGANALLAAVVIAKLQLTYLPGVAVAFVCAFGGVQSLQTAVGWARRHVISDAAAASAREEAQRQTLERSGDPDKLAEHSVYELDPLNPGPWKRRPKETPDD